MKFYCFILILLCAGCMRVGPDYETPPADTQDTWLETSHITFRSEDGELSSWWHEYHDETLNELINFALQQNYNLEAACYRILAARANLDFAIGEQYPQTFQLEGSAIKTHISKNAPNVLNIDRSFWDIVLGLRVAWELDFWGRFYRGVEEAYGRYMASRDDYEDVTRLLISDIVLNYVQLKTIFQRIATLERNIAIQYRSVEITKVRFESGYESELDNAQAVALWKQTESLKEVLKVQEKAFFTSLAILAGLTPEEFACRFSINIKPLFVPSEAVVGFPAEILCQRPDLRRSLDLIFSQNARVGIAVSELYPHISFTGFLGFESTQLKNLVSASSLTFFYGPSFVWNFFSFGRLEARVREQCALLKAAIATYRNQVLVAYKEVEDALTFYARSIEETKDLEESFAHAKRAVDISVLQYQEGIADYTRVLNSLQLQVETEDQLYQAIGNIDLAFATIYRSLGVF